MCEIANAASRRHMKDTDMLPERNSYFYPPQFRGAAHDCGLVYVSRCETLVSSFGDGRLIPAPFLSKTGKLGIPFSKSW